MSKGYRLRNKEKRKQKKLEAKRARRALYLAQSKAGKRKGEHAKKKLDPNRYGKIWEKAVRKGASL